MITAEGLALVLEAPRTLAFERLERCELAPREVRVHTMYSGISAGTELSQYRGTNPFMNSQWDPGSRLFKIGAPSWPYPVRNLGYEEVGEIVETGREVKSVLVGHRVFGTWGHRTHHVITEDYASDHALPKDADPRIGIFSHIGAVALNGVHDAQIRMGDLAVVFGLGVPGQIVAQMARASGATVVGVDPSDARREMALQLGTHRVLDPNKTPIAETIKRETRGRGADVCIEVSGTTSALAEAIRTVAYSSRVIALGFYQGEARGLHLGQEFHHNRVELVCSQISGVAPAASHRWNKLRLWQSAVRLQHEGSLNLTALITQEAEFNAAPSLFAQLDSGTAAGLQAMLTFEPAA